MLGDLWLDLKAQSAARQHEFGSATKVLAKHVETIREFLAMLHSAHLNVYLSSDRRCADAGRLCMHEIAAAAMTQALAQSSHGLASSKADWWLICSFPGSSSLGEQAPDLS